MRKAKDQQNTTQCIASYISSLDDKKQVDISMLHNTIMQMMPGCELWFLDGKDANGKTISNPNIGYGNYSIQYADGSSKDFYRIGLSANSVGISVYIFGIQSKTYLIEQFAKKIGKARVSSYCIKFKKLSNIDLSVLLDAIKSGMTGES